MNKKFAIPAIAMFAVIMGLGVIAPAMAAPNNDKSSATTAVCHYFAEYLDEEETELDLENSAWGVLFVSSQGAANGHEKHGDDVWDPEGEQTLEDFTTACEEKNLV